ncbi:MAG: translation initiation factor IF-6 [Euryarchaeota archaeon]|nr:translation initiation factor IF-6 [Euryarchaeota archaeon]
MLKLSTYNGVEFVGVYAIANEKFGLAPHDADKTFIDDIEEALGVTVTRATIAGTNLLGSLIAMNSYGAVVTSMATEQEVEFLSKHLHVARIEDRLNAAGNNILANDNGAIVNPEVNEDALKLIEETLQVEVYPMTVAGHKTVGSVCAATNKGVLCHPDTKRSEFDIIKSVMKVPASIGTLNYGSPMIGASIVANSKGGAVGFRSTPIELGRLEDALSLY